MTPNRNRPIQPSAREWFAHLRPLLLASRPVEYHDHKYLKDENGKPIQVAVYGKPTYRNVVEK